MILVTGATGEFGKHAVQQLREKGVSTSDISVLSRSEEKAISYKEDGITVKTGDYTNYDSLVKAFEGVDKLLFVSSSEIENREAQHENVVRAAKSAGDRKSTRLNSSHVRISYAVFCLKKKKKK